MVYPELHTDTDIHEALLTRIAAIVGLPENRVIKTDQSGPRPEPPFVTVSLLGTRAIRDNPRGFAFDPPDRDDDVEDTAGNLPDVTAMPLIDTEWHFSVWAYGSTQPTGLLRPIRSAAELSQIMEPVYPFLTVQEVSRIRYLPEIVNERPEPRAQCDIFLHGVTRDGFVIDTIDDSSITVSRL